MFTSNYTHKDWGSKQNMKTKCCLVRFKKFKFEFLSWFLVFTPKFYSKQKLLIQNYENERIIWINKAKNAYAFQ